MVYADGVDLDNLDTATPVGITCRVCQRTDCEQRAFPSLRHRLQVDENVRGVSLYMPMAGGEREQGRSSALLLDPDLSGPDVVNEPERRSDRPLDVHVML